MRTFTKAYFGIVFVALIVLVFLAGNPNVGYSFWILFAFSIIALPALSDISKFRTKFYWNRLKERGTQVILGILIAGHAFPLYVVTGTFPTYSLLLVTLAIVHCILETLVIAHRTPKIVKTVSEIVEEENESLAVIEANRQKLLAGETETELDVRAQHTAIMKRIRNEK